LLNLEHLKSHFSQIKYLAFFGIKNVVICSIYILQKKCLNTFNLSNLKFIVTK